MFVVIKYKFKMKDGKEVTVTEWRAEKPKALLQISHGMAEHAGRYNEFAEYMAKNGYTVFADDHRAHGETDKDTLGYSDGDIWENTLSDLHELTTYYKNKYNLPVVIFGHSYGSFLTQEYIERHAKDIKGAVVGGSCYMKQAFVPAGKFIANIGCAFKGKKAKANLLCKLSFGAYEKKLGGTSFISSLPEEAERYKQDEYCDFVMSYNFYKCFFSGLRRIYKKNKLSNLKGLPVFLIAGSDDPVGNFSKGVLKLKKVYDGYGAKTSALIQDGVRHEYLNDKDKAEAYRAIKEFCDGVIDE